MAAPAFAASASSASSRSSVSSMQSMSQASSVSMASSMVSSMSASSVASSMTSSLTSSMAPASSSVRSSLSSKMSITWPSSAAVSASKAMTPWDAMRQVKIERSRRKGRNDETGRVNALCIQAAVATREMSIAKAFSAFASTMSEAYAERSAALSSVWEITDNAGRRLGLRNAWDAFQKTGKTARETLAVARKDAWKLYKAQVKDCGITSTGEEGGETFDLSI